MEHALNPETFESAMQARLGRDFRLRWEPRAEVFCIEQKSAHGTYENPTDYSDPAYERVRDGYSLVMEIAPRPWVKCVECTGIIPLPELRFAEVRCPWCAYKGEKEIHFTGYFPLSDRLLEHLDRLSPKRVLDAARERDKRNYEAKRTAARDYDNRSEAILSEPARKIVRDAETLGWTPRGAQHHI